MADVDLPTDEAALVQEVVQLTGRQCVDCETYLCGHQIVINVILGFKQSLRCLDCTARRLDRSRQQLRDHLFQLIRRRDCYRQAWENEENCCINRSNQLPVCLWHEEEVCDSIEQSTIPSSIINKEFSIDEEWNAGEMSCGDLVLALRIRLQQLSPESVLKVIALDTAASEDLPAWCRLTGHRLLSASHPEYIIERKRD